MNKKVKFILPFIIIIVVGLIVKTIFSNPPENKRFKLPKSAVMTVEVTTLEPEDYQVMVNSFGTVRPKTESILVAQASGQIVDVDEQFRNGGFFTKGDVLVQLDDRDHKAEVKVSQARLLSAKQVLLEEQARVQQAKADWQRLGNGKEANALVLREPQLAAAQAQVLSAEAQLDKAKLMLERTKIVAPYSGRILNKRVGLGQVVNNNTALADIYAIDAVEVRLPIKNKDLPLVRLPEEYQDVGILGSPNDVYLTSELLGTQRWQGKVIRTESAIDEFSQQLYVIAQINKPYEVSADLTAPIKIGQYVNAEIVGRKLSQVIVVPNKAIYQGSYVYTVKDGLIFRTEVELGWQNAQEAIVIAGLNSGDKLVLTALGQVTSGTSIKIKGQDTPSKSAEEGVRGEKPSGKRLEQLKKIAEQRGISVDELIAERKKMRQQQGEK